MRLFLPQLFLCKIVCGGIWRHPSCCGHRLNAHMKDLRAELRAREQDCIRRRFLTNALLYLRIVYGHRIW